MSILYENFYTFLLRQPASRYVYKSLWTVRKSSSVLITLETKKSPEQILWWWESVPGIFDLMRMGVSHTITPSRTRFTHLVHDLLRGKRHQFAPKPRKAPTECSAEAFVILVFVCKKSESSFYQGRSQSGGVQKRRTPIVSKLEFFYGAPDRTWTCTLADWNLNPACLPIPPQARVSMYSW